MDVAKSPDKKCLSPDPSVPDDLSGPRRRSSALVALAVFAVYLLVPTREFYWDGVHFALAIEAPHGSLSALLQPNHLIYNLMGYAVWKSVAAIGIPLRALFLLQMLNALFAAASMHLVWRILTAMTKSARASMGGALIFACSGTWWKFASDADAYIPSIFFLLLSFHLLVVAKRPRPIAVGLAHSAAMLFHQLALFFFPAALVGLLCERLRDNTSGTKRRHMILAAEYGVTAGAITGAAYLTAFRAAFPNGGIRQFGDWITTHSPETALSFSLWHGLRYTLRGTGQLFFAGRVTQVRPDAVTAAGALVFCASLALLFYFGRRWFRAVAPTFPNGAVHGLRSWLATNGTSLAWTIAYVAFLCCWLPKDTFYRLFYLPPLIILLATAPIWRGDRAKLLALVAAAMCAWNFTVFIYPHSKTEANEVLSFALRHHSDWESGSAVVYRDFHSDLWTISYFNPQVSWIAMPSPDADQVERYRSDVAQKDHSLWLEGTAYDTLAAVPAGQGWIDRHVDRKHSLLYTSPSHRIRFYRVVN
jgi:hypothetical protein